MEDVGRSCPETPSSGLRLILEEFGTAVPESPLGDSATTSRKELDASRLFSLQKNKWFQFCCC